MTDNSNYLSYRSIRVGDIVVARKIKYGVILELDDGDFHDDMIMWAKIMWADNCITWEDMTCSIEDKIFEVLSESR